MSLPLPAPAPMPLFVPPPAPVPAPAPQEPCPFCRASNPLNARFCNSCGKHMDGSVTPPPRAVEPPPVFEPPFPVDPPPVFEPPRAAEPLRPMERPPEREGPMSRPLSPLGAPEPQPSFSPDAEHTFASLSTQMPHPIEPEPSLAPETAAPEAAAPARKRPLAVLVFVAAAAVSGAAAWMYMRPAPVAETPPTSATGADLNLSAPAHSPEMGGAPSPQTQTAALEPASTRTGSPAPAARKPYPKLKPASEFSPQPLRKPRTARRAKPVPLPREPDAADAILIESRAADSEPSVPGAGAGGEPLTDPDAAPADFLPGIPRRPGLKSPKAKPAKAAKALKTVKAAEEADAQALDSVLGEFSEPGAAAAQPAASAPISIGQKAEKAAASAANPADALAIQQAVEEFEFCSQLLTQGAYADHFDTCLCKETREKAPYRNRRGFYVSSLEKEAAAGRLEVKAEIVSTRMENGVARIVAKWKARGNDPGREVDEAWIMDDGLWCKAP